MKSIVGSLIATAGATLLAICCDCNGTPPPVEVQLCVADDDCGTQQADVTCKADKTFELLVKANGVPGLVGFTRAEVQYRSPGSADAGAPRFTVNLAPGNDDGDVVSGRLDLPCAAEGPLPLTVTTVGVSATRTFELSFAVKPELRVSVQALGDAGASALPGVGEIVDVVAFVTAENGPQKDVTVTVRTLPPLNALPETGATDRDGGFVTHFISPADASVVYVRVTAGDYSGDSVLRRGGAE